MMRHMAAVAIAVAILAGSAASYAEEPLTDAKRADVERLLQTTGALKIGQTLGTAMTRHFHQALRTARPDIPAELFDVMAEEIQKTVAEGMTARGGFVDLVVPLYHRYFSHDDIKAMLAFYATPVGQTTISVMPQMTQESLLIGQQWAQQMQPVIEKRIKARFKQRGIDL